MPPSPVPLCLSQPRSPPTQRAVPPIDGCRFMRARRLFHVDDDELLYFNEPMNKIIARLPPEVSCVVLVNVEAVPKALDADCVFSVPRPRLRAHAAPRAAAVRAVCDYCAVCTPSALAPSPLLTRHTPPHRASTPGHQHLHAAQDARLPQRQVGGTLQRRDVARQAATLRPVPSRARASHPLPPTRGPAETRLHLERVADLGPLTPLAAGPHRFTGSYHVVPVTCACVLHFESCTYEQWRNKFLKHRNTDEKKKAEMCEPLPTPAAPACAPTLPRLLVAASNWSPPGAAPSQSLPVLSRQHLALPSRLRRWEE